MLYVLKLEVYVWVKIIKKYYSVHTDLKFMKLIQMIVNLVKPLNGKFKIQSWKVIIHQIEKV